MRVLTSIILMTCSFGHLCAQTEMGKGAFSYNHIRQTFLTATEALINHYWAASFQGCDSCYYFNAAGDEANKKNEWWWQAHAMDVIVDAYRLSGKQYYKNFYEKWFDGIVRYNYEKWTDDPWRNQSVDDMEWIALTLIHMYETSGEKKYLLQARRLYDRYIITTWGPSDEAPWHGGISWSTDPKIHKTKNACSNGPAGIIASLLARHAKELTDGQSRKLQRKYQDDLTRIYQWERKYLYNDTTGAVYDHISRNRTAHRVWSYNTATFMAMGTELYRLTHRQQYINDAIKAADYTILRLSDPNTGLMNNVSRLENGGDMGLFHGIFFRYLSQLINSNALPADKKEDYSRFIAANCNTAIRCLQPGVDIFSKNWMTERISTAENAPLTPHVTGCTLLYATLSIMNVNP